MLGRSWELTKTAWRVLRDDRQLAVFPAIAFLAGLVVISTFAFPAWLARGDGGISWSGWSVTGWILLVAGYFVLSFVMVFCNAALLFAANERLTGAGPGTVDSGFEGARRHVGAIAGWALLSASVSAAIQVAEQRLGIVGRIITKVIGFVWSVATLLALPILVIEGLGPIDSLKLSGQLLKTTWGENITGNIGFGLLSLAVLVPPGALGAVGVFSGSLAVAVPCIAVAVVLGLAAIAVISALNGIYRVALYRYAVDGTVSGGFEDFPFSQAFRPK